MSGGTVWAEGMRLKILSKEKGQISLIPTKVQRTSRKLLGAFLNINRTSITASDSQEAVMLILRRFKNKLSIN